MGGQKEDFYHNFSRKDLQDLCKKYGLPANKSNSDMASSLILYLEKKNLNSRIWKANGGDPFSVETLEPRRRRISPSGDRQKDSRGTMSSSGSGNNQCNIQNGQHDLQNSKDPATSDKVSEDVGILSLLHRDSNSSADLLENTFPCDVRSSVQAPSHFQFDVSSEDGIQLFVDLNSSPSDWIESLKDGVHICSDMHKLETPNYLNETSRQCCCKHMKVSSLVDSYEEVDNRDVAEGSHPVTTGMGALPESNELNGAEGSLSSPSRDPGNTTRHLENFGEEQATTSSRPESDIEKHVCGAKFCIRAGIMPADPNADVVPQVKTFNNSFEYSSSFAERSKMLESKIMNVDGDIYNRPSLQQMHGPQDPVVVCTELSSSPSQEIRESSSNTFDQDRVTVCQDITGQPQNNGTEQCGLTNSVPFTEMETFEVAAGHTKSASSSGLLDGHSSDPTDVDQDKVEIENNKASTSEQNGAGHCTLSDSDDLDKDVQKSQLTSMEILGRVVAGDQRKKSEDSTTHTWRKSSGSESSRDHKRKLLVNGTGGQNQSDAKLTRITRQFTGKIRDSRRRSSRLFTK